MKYLILLLLSAVVSKADVLKLNFVEQSALIQALAALDGSSKLDASNNRVQVPYDFSGSTRLIIAKDITALRASITIVQTAVKNAGIVDGMKETDAQKKTLEEILNTKSDVPLTKLTESDLRVDVNPIPGTVLSSLTPIIK